MTRAAIYLRISSDRDGEGLGVQRQEEDCRKLAERLDLEVVEVFKDNDIGASEKSRKRRPDYERMLGAARTGRFQVILAYSNSRLTRRMMELEDLIQLHNETGVAIRTVMSGDDNLSTEDGKMVARIKASVDAAEAGRISERVKRAAQQRSERGLFHGGPASFGYTLDPSTKLLVPVSEQAAMLNEAADRLLKRHTLYSICVDWNDRGLRTPRGAIWRSRTIRDALKSSTVIGETTAGVKGGWQPIMDKDKQLAVVRLLNDASRMFGVTSGSRPGKNALGSGLTVCGLCGKPLLGQTHRGKPRLICQKQFTGGCGKVTIQHRELEEYVFAQITSAIRTDPGWRARLSAPRVEDGTEIAAAEASRLAIQERLARLVDLRVDGLIERHEFDKRQHVILAKQEAVNKRLAELHSTEFLLESVDIATGELDWRSWSSVKRRGFLRLVIDRVVVRPWPVGVATTLTPFRGESADDLAARRAEHTETVLRQRVRVVWL